MVSSRENMRITMELTSRGKGLVADLNSGRWVAREIVGHLNKEPWALTFSHIANAEIANTLKNISVSGPIASSGDLRGTRKNNYWALAKHYRVVYYGSNQYGVRITVRSTELGKIYWHGHGNSYRISTNSSSTNRGNWYGSKMSNADVLKFEVSSGELVFSDSVMHPPIPRLEPIIRGALLRSIDKTNNVIRMYNRRR